MFPLPRPLRSRWFAAVAILSSILLIHGLSRSHRVSFGLFAQNRVNVTAGNATLGFQSIIVVAPRNVPPRLAWRKEGLLKAAARTGLDVEFPLQPAFTDAQVDAMKAKNKEMKHGFALSFLGHLHALKEATTRTTTLILEDDVDWDVEIRKQMPMVASAVRNLTGQTDTSHDLHGSFAPYGMQWDVLWLGHCGDSIRGDRSDIKYYDATVPPKVNSWDRTISPDPNHTRWVYWSSGPVCTYAYAVTSSAATKLLDRDDHGSDNFDIWLHILCKGQKIRCVSANPELFHHHELAGHKDSLANGVTDSEDITTEMTDNIWHSARCNSNAKTDSLVTCMGKEEPESQSG